MCCYSGLLLFICSPAPHIGTKNIFMHFRCTKIPFKLVCFTFVWKMLPFISMSYMCLNKNGLKYRTCMQLFTWWVTDNWLKNDCINKNILNVKTQDISMWSRIIQINRYLMNMDSDPIIIFISDIVSLILYLSFPFSSYAHHTEYWYILLILFILNRCFCESLRQFSINCYCQQSL